MPTEDARSDEALIAALNHGDWSAFESLYHRHKDWVHRLACRYTDRDAALDVLQDVFAYFMAQFPGFRLTARLTTYLYPVVKNTALAANRRSRKLKFGEVPDVPSLEVQLPEGDLGDLVRTLPDGQLEVLLMRVIDGMSVEEVGAALGIAEGTVKSRLHNALERLRADERAKKYFSP